MIRVFRKSFFIISALAFVAALWAVDALRDRSSPPKYVIVQNPLLFVVGAFWIGWIVVNSADKILGLRLQERDSMIPFYISLALGAAAFLAAWAGVFTGYAPEGPNPADP